MNAALPYKLDYYLDYEVAVRSVSCVGGRQQLTTTVSLHSHVPADISSLSEYVAPRRVPLFGAGTIATTVYFVAPEDGSIRSLTVDGKPGAGRPPVVGRTDGLRPDDHARARSGPVPDRRRAGRSRPDRHHGPAYDARCAQHRPRRGPDICLLLARTLARGFAQVNKPVCVLTHALLACMC